MRGWLLLCGYTSKGSCLSFSYCTSEVKIQLSCLFPFPETTRRPFLLPTISERQTHFQQLTPFTEVALLRGGVFSADSWAVSTSGLGFLIKKKREMFTLHAFYCGRRKLPVGYAGAAGLLDGTGTACQSNLNKSWVFFNGTRHNDTLRERTWLPPSAVFVPRSSLSGGGFSSSLCSFCRWHGASML